MSTQYLTTDLIQSGTILDLGATSGASLFVTAGTFLATTSGSEALKGSGTNQIFTVAGAVSAGSTNTIQASGDGAIVNVLEGGTVSNSSTLEFATVNLGISTGGTSTLFNHGQIAGGAGIYTGQSSLIVNTGLISGSANTPNSGGALIGSQSGDAIEIVNAGTIVGAHASINYYFGGGASVDIDNSGTLIGNVLLGHAGTSTVTNTGRIDGSIIFGDGDDSYFGAQGGSVVGIDAGSGSDWLTGSNADDGFYGGDGNDILKGRRGDDTLWGDAGDDNIRGGRGDDTIVGGTGRDTMRGGHDDDTFVFLSANESGRGHGADRIMDFSRAEDHIDLSALGGSETVTFANKGYGTLVKVDADGDGTVDFHIKVMHVHGLTLDHFIL